MRPWIKNLLVIAVLVYLVANTYKMAEIVQRVGDLEHMVKHLEGNAGH